MSTNLCKYCLKFRANITLTLLSIYFLIVIDLFDQMCMLLGEMLTSYGESATTFSFHSCYFESVPFISL